MGNESLLDAIPLWLMFAITVGLILFAVEGGYRVGIVRARSSEQEREAPIDAMVGATLGLLAFMLAFTFGMATTRHDTRKKLVLDEAVSIRSADLRAQLLPEPHRNEIRTLLREYVDIRSTRWPPDQLRQAIAHSEQLQGLLWSRTASLDPEVSGAVLGPLAAALIEMNELHMRRLDAGLHDRIPGTIWTALYCLAALAMAIMGYRAGIAGRRGIVATLALALAFSAVIVLIVDLDRPWESLTTVSQQAMLDLQSKLLSLTPAETPR